jgi:hypothetical protein
MLATFVNFPKTAQSKQSPNGRKFAQSGHPGNNLNSEAGSLKMELRPSSKFERSLT